MKQIQTRSGVDVISELVSSFLFNANVPREKLMKLARRGRLLWDVPWKDGNEK